MGSLKLNMKETIGRLMRILLTNDDGIYADGLRAACSELAELGQVFVVAPDREKSATGHGITVHRPLRVEEVHSLACAKKAWAVDGTPSDCVKIAIECLLDVRPDIVLSGINRGPNLGTDVLYSGTVSAAIEGVILGLPAVAISLAAIENPYYDFAAKFTRRIAVKVLEEGLPPDTLLNINIPSLPREDITGLAVTRLGVRKYRNVFDKRIDPRGRTYYWLAGEVVEVDDGPDTDSTALKNNMISITPIHFDLTRVDMMEMIRRWDIRV